MKINYAKSKAKTLKSVAFVRFKMNIQYEAEE